MALILDLIFCRTIDSSFCLLVFDWCRKNVPIQHKSVTIYGKNRDRGSMSLSDIFTSVDCHSVAVPYIHTSSSTPEIRTKLWRCGTFRGGDWAWFEGHFEGMLRHGAWKGAQELISEDP